MRNSATKGSVGPKCRVGEGWILQGVGGAFQVGDFSPSNSFKEWRENCHINYSTTAQLKFKF